MGAKASTLITHVPDAIAHGAEIRDHCMVSRVNMRNNGRVTGRARISTRNGNEHLQKAQSGHRLRLCHRDAALAAELRLSGLREWAGKFQRYASDAI